MVVYIFINGCARAEVYTGPSSEENVPLRRRKKYTKIAASKIVVGRVRIL